MDSSDLIPTRCAICNTLNNAVEIFPANFEVRSLNPDVFSARRFPDKIHYCLVKCKQCGLVRSDPIASKDLLAQLYQRSTFTYTDEIPNLTKTYGRSLAALTDFGVKKRVILEIGCGNGFFLEEALSQGYDNVFGVEPSLDAVEHASPIIRKSITCSMMKPGLFDEEQIDVICMFQVLDHVSDPNGLLEECYRILKPGGLALCINHNISSWSAKIFKERSPVIDIEHTYLYNPTTLSRLFEMRGFIVKRVGSINNYYSIYYLLRLLPLPVSIKTRLLNFITTNKIMHLQLSLPLGNIELVAQKV